MADLDPNLREYATARQWELLSALVAHGSERKAAAALGVVKSYFHSAKRAVVAKAARAGYSPDHDMLHPTAPGFRLKGTSTLYDEGGNKRLQWVKTTIDQEQQDAIFKAAIEAMTSDLPRFKPVKAPRVVEADLMHGVPVGDHHIGLLAWAKETGADYDLEIAEHLLCRAFDYLIDAAPHCAVCLIDFLGDLAHYDSFKPLTPTSGHLLDADSRFPKMVAVVIRCLRYVIGKALAKHQAVHVIYEPGNHDISTAIFMMQLLANVYENEPRVTIDTSPMFYHYFRFGKNLIGSHHGHLAKPAQLPLIMATDRAEDWGQTEHRVWWTGHIHHETKQDYPGCPVESFRVLPPEDAHAHQSGYRSIRDMKSIIFHREFGETSRHTVSPAMFGRAAA